VYGLGPSGLGVLADDLARDALAGFDAVLDDDGEWHEGPSGTHGGDAFWLPTVEIGADVATVLAALHDAGTRSLVLHGGRTTAAPFLAADVVDEVDVYVHGLRASGRPAIPPSDWPLAPPGFRLQRVRPVDGAVLVEAIRNRDGPGEGEDQAGPATVEP
jgi:RibD C-terminal domain